MDLREASNMTLEQEMKHWWVQTRHAYLHNCLGNFTDNLPQKKLCLLEVGCGTGQNIFFLRHHPIWGKVFDKIVGIDPALPEPFSPSWLGKNDRLLPELKEKTKFDVLLAMDVLEHIEDDTACLQNWLSHMKPEGLVFITVPALQFMWSHHDEMLNHYRRYNKKALLLATNASGLKTLHCNYAFSFLLPPAFLIRILNKQKFSKGLSTTYSWINTILCRLGEFEASRGGVSWGGLSLFGIFKISK